MNYGVVNCQNSIQCIMNETILKTGADLVSREVGNVPPGSLEELTKVSKMTFKQAYELQGPERVRELNYHQGNINREIIKLGHETLETKVFIMIKDQFPQGVPIPCAEI